MLDIDVLIVTYESAGMIAGALDSVRGCRRVQSTVVVDNASDDGSADRARAAGATQVIENAVNLGFAAAVNRGLAACDAPYVLLLNPDARIDPPSLDALAGALEDDANAAMAGPVLIGTDGRLELGARRFSTVLNRLLWHLPLIWRPQLSTPDYKDAARLAASPASLPVDYLWGAALLVRRTFLADIGGLDERFFLYSEDEDLGRRARALGLRVLLVPRARAVHAGGESTPDRALSLARVISANALLLEKWEGHSAALVFRQGIGPVLTAREFLLWAMGRDIEADSIRRTHRLLRPGARIWPADDEAQTAVPRVTQDGSMSLALGYIGGTCRLAARVALTGVMRAGRAGGTLGASATSARAHGNDPFQRSIRPRDEETETDDSLVSVILPVYNAATTGQAYLRAALESVAAQDDGAMELVVVDDGSTDETAELVSDLLARWPGLSARVVRKANGGQSSARNAGARESRGSWLAFLDQDDMWTEDHLRTVRPYLEGDVDLVYTDADTVDEKGTTRDVRIHHSLGRGGGHPKKRAEDAIFQNVFVMPGVMTIRHDFFDALNGFDEDLAGYEDDDLFVRSLAAGRLRYVPASTLLWRIHPTSASHTQRMVESGLRYWRKLMDRFATGEGSTVIARQLTLRFTRIFLSDASRQLLAGDPLYERNLEAAETLMRHLGVVDRAAFAATRWGWRRTSFPARCARSWYLNGLREASRF